ncbi:hypothetical protein WA171_002950 [Blastocystis sp. BT1]
MDCVIDLTNVHEGREESDSINVASSSDDFENEAKDIQELEDYELARSLQIAEYTNWNREIDNRTAVKRKQEDVVVEAVDIKLKKQKCEDEGSYLLNKQFITNVLASELELIDPTPNISALFELYNKEFFYDSLKYITVRWSKRMTLCAGICRMKGLNISISLSEPLLSLRQRADTVNTLLHEMIHAYLFVTHNYLDRDDHGAEFKKHMHRINAKAHSHITIYHSFHDEVDSCRKWWWKCDGPCQFKPPFFGIVKRSMNRPPQKADWWFEKHQKECGGTYHLIKSPDKPTESKVVTVESLFKKCGKAHKLTDS